MQTKPQVLRTGVGCVGVVRRNFQSRLSTSDRGIEQKPDAGPPQQ
jgi:hypothetical protein